LCTSVEPRDHRGSNISGYHLRAETCGRDAHGTAASRHVKEAYTRVEIDAAEDIFRKSHRTRSDELVKAWRDSVPCGPRPL
jgi:hypothetical protein